MNKVFLDKKQLEKVVIEIKTEKEIRESFYKFYMEEYKTKSLSFEMKMQVLKSCEKIKKLYKKMESK